jgi:transposase
LAACATSRDKKIASQVHGVVLFEDEASFQLDPTLHRTWARIGRQPRVATRGERKTAHLYGAIALHDARFTYQFVDVFNGRTFLGFLKALVKRYRRKIFLIIDNAPCHNLGADGRAWLDAHRHRIELHRLPPYSPELNAIEGVWKTTRRRATHNRYFDNIHERDAAICLAFQEFADYPSLIDGHVRRFRE